MDKTKYFVVLILCYACLYMPSFGVEAKYYSTKWIGPDPRFVWNFKYNLCNDELSAWVMRVCYDQVQIGGKLLRSVAKCCQESCTLRFIKNTVCPYAQPEYREDYDSMPETTSTTAATTTAEWKPNFYLNGAGR